LADLTAVTVVAAATWRELARRRRLLALAALLLIPVLLLLAIRQWYPGEAPAGLLLSLLARDVYIPFLLPIVALALGAPAISEPIAEGTLVYFWTRPLRRRALFLGRILAAALVACVMVMLSQTAVFLMLLGGGFGSLDLALLRMHAELSVVILLGTLAYTAVFGCFGAGFKKPLVPGLLLVFGWEGLVADIPQRIQEWTLRFHLRNLVTWPEAQPADLRGILEALMSRALARPEVPAWQSALVLLALVVATTLAGVYLLRRRQLDRQG
jgi:ABC-2 type transport system permease protein